ICERKRVLDLWVSYPHDCCYLNRVGFARDPLLFSRLQKQVTANKSNNAMREPVFRLFGERRKQSSVSLTREPRVVHSVGASGTAPPDGRASSRSRTGGNSHPLR